MLIDFFAESIKIICRHSFDIFCILSNALSAKVHLIEILFIRTHITNTKHTRHVGCATGSRSFLVRRIYEIVKARAQNAQKKRRVFLF